MSEWKEVKLGDVLNFRRGYDLPKTKMKKGNIPVAGSNGVIGYHNEYTTNAPCITIGRSGNIGNAYLYKENFWAHNTTLYVDDFKGNDIIFLYYFLLNIDFKSFNVGSAVPTLNRNHIHPLLVKIPPLPEQKAIAEVLSSLDDKIELLYKQNNTLEEMAETLFRQCFIEEAKEEWEEGKLGDLFRIRSGKTLKREFFVEDGLFPVWGANGIIGRTNHYLLDDKIIFTGRVGTLGNIFRINNEQVWLSDNTLIMQNVKYYNFVYFSLKNSELEQYNVGSTQPLIRQSDISEIPYLIPSDSHKLNEFEKFSEEVFKKIQDNKKQILTLEQMRDTLLPKLMSGEVRVEIK